MLKFLNETKQFIADEENSKLHKSIWAGIFITSIFGIIQCRYENHFNAQICLSLAFGIFILSCIIIKCNIKFFDFLKKYFPTYYNLVRILFKRKFVYKFLFRRDITQNPNPDFAIQFFCKFFNNFWQKSFLSF